MPPPSARVILPPIHRQRGAAATARSGLQSRQLAAHLGVARGGEAVVADHPA